MKEYCEDLSGFESGISRHTLHTFAAEGENKKHTGIDGKVLTAFLRRDLFGSTLYLSFQK